jgi:hypothetical protein
MPPGKRRHQPLRITLSMEPTRMTNTIIANRNAEKQRRLRERRLEQGLKLHSVWVPERIIADINEIAEKARKNPNLDVVVYLRDRTTGRFVR